MPVFYVEKTNQAIVICGIRQTGIKQLVPVILIDLKLHDFSQYCYFSWIFLQTIGTINQFLHTLICLHF